MKKTSNTVVNCRERGLKGRKTAGRTRREERASEGEIRAADGGK